MNVKVNGSEAGEGTRILEFFQVERKIHPFWLKHNQSTVFSEV